MPSIAIGTNVSKAKIPAEFCKNLVSCVAKLTGKPEAVVMVQMCPDQPMMFGVNTDPCANVTLHSAGSVGGDKNETIAKELTDLVEKGLGVKRDRIFIKIFDVEPKCWAFQGKTLAAK